MERLKKRSNSYPVFFFLLLINKCYRRYTEALWVPTLPAEELGCENQYRFDTQVFDAPNIYWDQDCCYHSNMPDRKSFACKSVGCQTVYFAIKQGDDQKCVERYFNVEVIQ